MARNQFSASASAIVAELKPARKKTVSTLCRWKNEYNLKSQLFRHYFYTLGITMHQRALHITALRSRQPEKLNRTSLKCICVALSLTLSGCGPYAFTLNERPIYTPPPLFSHYDLSDRNLHNCVQQTIADQRVTKAEALKRLECTYGGIETLEGLEVFTGLRQLNLAHNNLGDVAPLLKLPALERVRLTDNAQLECIDLPTLSERGVVVDLPEHCD